LAFFAVSPTAAAIVVDAVLRSSARAALRRQEAAGIGSRGPGRDAYQARVRQRHARRRRHRADRRAPLRDAEAQHREARRAQRELEGKSGARAREGRGRGRGG